ncbi:MAG TPA: lysophospholipid acyltransferase family protein [bacterium]|nr:lysophospholipid acyltransferase family protein [bacterium]
MLLERIRILLFGLWMLVYMLYHAKTRFRLQRLRRLGRGAEAEALVNARATDWGRWVFRNLHCRLEVEGAEHIPHDQAFVVYCNHQSKYDIPALLAALDMGIGFVVKRELFRIPGLTYWMRQINCLPLDRKDVSGGAEALAGLAADLKRLHKGFIIFPEGTRTRDPAHTVQPFRRGAIRLASEQELPVLPVTIDGGYLLDSHEAMAATRHGGRLIRIRIEPLRRVPGNSAPVRRQFMDELFETIRSNREAIRVEWPAA